MWEILKQSLYTDFRGGVEELFDRVAKSIMVLHVEQMDTNYRSLQKML